jgi:hypothetical protein
MRRERLGGRHVLTGETLAALGATRLAGPDPSDALPLLEEAVGVLRRMLPASHPSVVAATHDLERARQDRPRRGRRQRHRHRPRHRRAGA